jgi:hypothetical protein
VYTNKILLVQKRRKRATVDRTAHDLLLIKLTALRFASRTPEINGLEEQAF